MRAASQPATSRPQRLSDTILRFLRTYTIWIVIAALIVLMSVISRDFFTLTNLRTTVINMTTVALVAFGLTFVFLSGGFDLSSGATLILSATLLLAINPATVPVVVLGFLMILGLSAGIGAVNGYLIGVQRLNPFIVTLGVRTIIGAVIFALAARAVRGFTGQSEILEFIGVGRLFGVIPVLTVILIVVAVVCWFTVRFTPYARKILAVGANPVVARFSGLQVERLQMSTYIINALLAGLAGMLLVSKTSYVVPGLVWTHDFDAITACALGGISLSGGRGTILNALSGVILIVLIGNAMVLLRVPTEWQPILKGIVLLVAIIVDMQTKRSYA
jgi:ribose transport system permease protein